MYWSLGARYFRFLQGGLPGRRAFEDLKNKRKKIKKRNLKESVERITSILEEHLSNLPVDEQEARIAGFELKLDSLSSRRKTRPL